MIKSTDDIELTVNEKGICGLNIPLSKTVIFIENKSGDAFIPFVNGAYWSALKIDPYTFTRSPAMTTTAKIYYVD